MNLRFSRARISGALTAAVAMLSIACMSLGLSAAPQPSRVTDILARPEAFAGRTVEVSGVLGVWISGAWLYDNGEQFLAPEFDVRQMLTVRLRPTDLARLELYNGAVGTLIGTYENQCYERALARDVSCYSRGMLN